jgi:nucleoside-diphosphate-sugar epimerase
MSERCYFLTGASGLLGHEILREIARQDPAARTYAALRAPVGELEMHAARLGWRDVAPRALPIGADLSRAGAGLSPRDVERLTAEVTHVVHAGGSLRCDDDIHHARQLNVAGTRQLLELARRMRRLERFVHVGTSFVCGDLPGSLFEGPAPPGRFRNSYERSSFEAEEVVRRAMARLPITVVRPSIVAPPILAASASRATSPALHDGVVASQLRERNQPSARFLMLLRLYLTRGWRWVPGSPGSLVDLVPGDVVARATVALALRTHGDGRWYHLAAGPRAATLRELGSLASRRCHAPPPSFAPPGLLRVALRFLVWGNDRPLLESVAPYVPYLSVRTRVDTTDSQRVLRELGIEIPRVSELFTKLLTQLDLGGQAPDASRLPAAARQPARFSASRGRAEAAPRATARRS